MVTRAFFSTYLHPHYLHEYAPLLITIIILDSIFLRRTVSGNCTIDLLPLFSKHTAIIVTIRKNEILFTQCNLSGDSTAVTPSSVIFHLLICDQSVICTILDFCAACICVIISYKTYNSTDSVETIIQYDLT